MPLREPKTPVQLYTQEQIDRANQTSIMDYLQKAGYHPVQAGRNFELKGYGGLQIDPVGNRWNCRGNPDKAAKGGPIQLMQYLENISWVDAVGRLIDERGGYIPAEKKASHYEPRKTEFKLPERNATYHHMFAYLIQTRKIDAELVKNLVDQGLIYENDKKSCVFVGKDKVGEIRYASIRGTNTYGEAFKGEAAGSDKKFGFCIPGTGDTITVFESPIDALSYMTILKHKNASEIAKEETLLSLGGVEDLALEQYLKDHPSIKKIKLALDMDAAGGRGCENIARKYSSDYVIKRLVLQCKDYNQYLVEHYGELQQSFSGDIEQTAKDVRQEAGYFELYTLKENPDGRYVVIQFKSSNLKIQPSSEPVSRKDDAEKMMNDIVSSAKSAGICVEQVDSVNVMNRFQEVLTDEIKKQLQMEPVYENLP